MSKRQGTIFDFLTKKKPKENNTDVRQSQDQESSSSAQVSQEPQNVMPSTSNHHEENAELFKDSDADFQTTASLNPAVYDSKCHSIDIGIYLNKVSISDVELNTILKNSWLPDKNFSYPFSVHTKKEKEIKCYLSAKHFDNFKWLTYSEQLKGLFCKYCFLFATQGGKSHQSLLNKLVKAPLNKFSKLVGKDGDLTLHEQRKYHQEAIQKANHYLKTFENPQRVILNMVDQKRLEQVNENRERLQPIIETVLLLGKQNIPFRGHRDDGFYEDDFITSPANLGNFKALLSYRALGDQKLKNHLTSANSKSTYISKRTQNEIISCIGQEILGKIRQKVNQNMFYSVIFDETTDISGISQLSLVIRYVYNSKVYEDFLGFINCHKKHAEQQASEEPILSGHELADIVLNSLKEFSLDPKYCIGIATDGCSTMISERKGAVAKLKETLVNANKSQCYNHALNLSISKSTKIPYVRNLIGTMKETISFFSQSAKRLTVLKKLCTSKLIKMCETRWVERHKSIFRFCSSFTFIIDALETISNWQDRESATKANILKNSLLNSQFIVTLWCLSDILSNTVNLSQILQAKQMNRIFAKDMLKNVEQQLTDKRLRANENFALVFAKISSMHETLGLTVTRHRLANRQVNRANVPCNNEEDYYRISVYIPLIDHILEDIQFRFDDEFFSVFDLKVLSTLQNVPEDGQIRNLCALIDPFVDPDMLFERLKAEFELWRVATADADLNENTNINELYLKCDKEKDFFPVINKLFLYLLTLPASVASCERSFSALKRLKTWIRTNMTEERLSALADSCEHRHYC